MQFGHGAGGGDTALFEDAGVAGEGFGDFENLRGEEDRAALRSGGAQVGFEGAQTGGGAG